VLRNYEFKSTGPDRRKRPKRERQQNADRLFGARPADSMAGVFDFWNYSEFSPNKKGTPTIEIGVLRSAQKSQSTSNGLTTSDVLWCNDHRPQLNQQVHKHQWGQRGGRP